MTLSQFISQEIDAIVEEWAEFARENLPPARTLAPQELRDHARKLLLHVAEDMDSPQNSHDRHEKSRGNRPGNAPGITDTARQDAQQRFEQGFALNEVVAEYRALRASVVRRWREPFARADLDTVEELVRFNEAIDQATSEAIAWYTDRVEASRDLLMGVLGHDLRNPLGAVRNSAEYLMRTDKLTGAQTKAVARIQSSTGRMREMVDDLLDYTRTRLGAMLPVAPHPVHLGQVCRQAVDELSAFHPERTLRMDCSGELAGQWDASRLAQLLSNLVANAIQHSAPDTPVTVTVRGEAEDVVLQVHNEGPPITARARSVLFEPLMRPVVKEAERREGSSGLGLGLYIARQIAVAHGGEITVDSSEREGTTFNVRLPRQPQAKPGAAAS